MSDSLLLDLEAMTLLPAFPLTPEQLATRVWTFGASNATPWLHYVRLMPDSSIGGRLGPNERNWAIEDGKMVFFDDVARRSTVFDRVYRDRDGRLALLGNYAGAPYTEHLLREIDDVPGPAPAHGDLPLVRRNTHPKRRNLVIVRAGELSLHPQWDLQLLPSDRTWDLCVSFYGAADSFRPEPPHAHPSSVDWEDYRVHQPGGSKFASLHKLLHEASPLWDYDFIAFPDDDIMLRWRDWNELFLLCRNHRLDLAQPALSVESYIAHPITARDKRYLLRYTSFVEVMTPIFSQAALKLCVATFKDSVSGFGLDNAWPKLLGEPADRIAIIDKVPVMHMRAPGMTYRVEDAIAEGNALQERFDAPSHVVEFGGILTEPINRQHGWWGKGERASD